MTGLGKGQGCLDILVFKAVPTAKNCCPRLGAYLIGKVPGLQNPCMNAGCGARFQSRGLGGGDMQIPQG